MWTLRGVYFPIKPFCLYHKRVWGKVGLCYSYVVTRCFYPTKMSKRPFPIVFFKFFTHGTGIEKTWSSFQFVVISNKKFYNFCFHKLPTMETELLLHCSLNAYTMKLDRWWTSQEPLYKMERAESSPLSSIDSCSLFHVSSILWVVRFSKKMGIIFNCAITILTKARKWTIRKKNQAQEMHSGLRYPPLIKECFIQILWTNWRDLAFSFAR